MVVASSLATFRRNLLGWAQPWTVFHEPGDLAAVVHGSGQAGFVLRLVPGG